MLRDQSSIEKIVIKLNGLKSKLQFLLFFFLYIGLRQYPKQQILGILYIIQSLKVSFVFHKVSGLVDVIIDNMQTDYPFEIITKGMLVNTEYTFSMGDIFNQISSKPFWLNFTKLLLNSRQNVIALVFLCRRDWFS